MGGAPADLGDWGPVRLFYEGGRLLRKHFGDFLPIMLVFIFPACLAKVCYTQFYEVDFFRPRVLLLCNVGCKLRRFPRIQSQHHF
jgi:hypothetical protein